LYRRPLKLLFRHESQLTPEWKLISFNKSKYPSNQGTNVKQTYRKTIAN